RGALILGRCLFIAPRPGLPFLALGFDWPLTCSKTKRSARGSILLGLKGGRKDGKSASSTSAGETGVTVLLRPELSVLQTGAGRSGRNQKGRRVRKGAIIYIIGSRRL